MFCTHIVSNVIMSLDVFVRVFGRAKVPSYEHFRSLLEKLRVKDYSAKVDMNVAMLHLIAQLNVRTVGVHDSQAYGRGKKRKMLACLGEAARK